jgi:hypothetical protein
MSRVGQGTRKSYGDGAPRHACIEGVRIRTTLKVEDKIGTGAAIRAVNWVSLIGVQVKLRRAR